MKLPAPAFELVGWTADGASVVLETVLEAERPPEATRSEIETLPVLLSAEATGKQWLVRGEQRNAQVQHTVRDRALWERAEATPCLRCGAELAYARGASR